MPCFPWNATQLTCFGCFPQKEQCRSRSDGSLGAADRRVAVAMACRMHDSQIATLGPVTSATTSTVPLSQNPHLVTSFMDRPPIGGGHIGSLPSHRLRRASGLPSADMDARRYRPPDKLESVRTGRGTCSSLVAPPQAGQGHVCLRWRQRSTPYSSGADPRRDPSRVRLTPFR